MDQTRLSNQWENVNLLGFCQQVGHHFMPRIRRQGIQLEIDGDAALWRWVPVDQVRAMLSALIEDSLEAMPRGGELDLTIIPVGGGVEIEVADSRVAPATDLPVTIDAHRVATTDHTSSDFDDVPTIVQLVTQSCPQGGVARTLNIVHQDATISSRGQTLPLRRAA